MKLRKDIFITILGISLISVGIIYSLCDISKYNDKSKNETKEFVVKIDKNEDIKPTTNIDKDNNDNNSDTNNITHMNNKIEKILKYIIENNYVNDENNYDNNSNNTKTKSNTSVIATIIDKTFDKVDNKNTSNNSNKDNSNTENTTNKQNTSTKKNDESTENNDNKTTDSDESNKTTEKNIDNEENKYKKSNGIWFWTTSKSIYLTDTVKRENLLNNLEKLNTDTIYLSITDLSDYNDLIKYRDFISDSSKKNIRIEALVGDPGFIKKKNREKFINKYIDTVVRYNKEVNDNEKILGIQYDVEPYSDGFENDERILYMDFVKETYNYSRGKNITISFDIPRWFINIYYTENNEKYNIVEELIKNSDEILIMDYRNNANKIYEALIEKGNAIYKDEINYRDFNYFDLIKKYNKVISIGIEPVTLEEKKNIDDITDITDVTNEVNTLVTNYLKENNIDIDYSISIHDLHYIINKGLF